MLELLLLVYLASLIAAPIMAGKQGRNGLGWFLLAVLFGPIAVLVLAVTAGGSAKQEAKPSAYTRQCPHCRSDIPMQASACPACGRDVPKLDPFRDLRVKAGSLRENRCPECGGTVGARALACSHCRVDLRPYRDALIH